MKISEMQGLQLLTFFGKALKPAKKIIVEGKIIETLRSANAPVTEDMSIEEKNTIYMQNGLNMIVNLGEKLLGEFPNEVLEIVAYSENKSVEEMQKINGLELLAMAKDLLQDKQFISFLQSLMM